MQTNLMIESKFNDAMAYAHNAIKNFPRYEKYTLGVEISKTMWEIKRHMIAARFLHHKKTALRNLDHEMKLHMEQVRFAKKTHAINARRYEIWCKMLIEIGKMIGGWIKSQPQAASL
ncbi:diversity-generating retroelement protein Avd [Marinomonas spartinae]|uniref:diversity-generating retroelement protein Avd n=1 Tax=Marinomonas spartinae TaxID=1792290 RepID=UPI00082FBA20|nr:diversity-generating retroelement protein Avd [Marinomonas spartinae]